MQLFTSGEGVSIAANNNAKQGIEIFLRLQLLQQ
jgi:hypothetical protein